MRPLARRAAIVAALFAAVLFGTTFGFLFDDRRRQYLRVRSDLDRRRVRPAPPGERPTQRRRTRVRRGGAHRPDVEQLRTSLEKVDTDGGVEIIVVDDGSVDDTSARASCCRCGSGAAPRSQSRQGGGCSNRRPRRSRTRSRVHRCGSRVLTRPDHRVAARDRGRVGRRDGESPSHRHHHARARPPVARDRRPRHQRARPERCCSVSTAIRSAG